MNNDYSMAEKNNKISNRLIIAMAIILSLAVVFFETAQQFFYVTLYQLNNETTFNDLFLSQSRKWLIWIIFAIPLWYFIKKIANQTCITAKHINWTILVIISLLVLVIFTMSFVEIIWAQSEFTIATFNNYFTFYTYQKTPIYSFGYTFLSIIFYLYSKNNQLAFQVLKFNQLNKNDLSQYHNHKDNTDQNNTCLLYTSPSPRD